MHAQFAGGAAYATTIEYKGVAAIYEGIDENAVFSSARGNLVAAEQFVNIDFGVACFDCLLNHLFRHDIIVLDRCRQGIHVPGLDNFINRKIGPDVHVRIVFHRYLVFTLYH